MSHHHRFLLDLTVKAKKDGQWQDLPLNEINKAAHLVEAIINDYFEPNKMPKRIHEQHFRKYGENLVVRASVMSCKKNIAKA